MKDNGVKMFESYEKGIKYIDELIDFLGSRDIYAESRSHVEDDYLLSYEYFENYTKNPSTLQDDRGRSAFIGLYELYNWIWSVKDCVEFEKLSEHLKLLVQCSPNINSYTSMYLDPKVTVKTEKRVQDDKSNKFVEAILGMFAVKIGTNVDLDDPMKSSGGENPDIIFDFRGNRISFACKTPRGESIETLIANFKSAAEQIERADCDYGFIVINAMNITNHKQINTVFDDPNVPLDIIVRDVDSKYYQIAKTSEIEEDDVDKIDEVKNIFTGKKTRLAVVTLIHSATRIRSVHGNLLTSLKTTNVSNFDTENDLPENDLILLNLLNEFIHGRL